MPVCMCVNAQANTPYHVRGVRVESPVHKFKAVTVISFLSRKQQLLQQFVTPISDASYQNQVTVSGTLSFQPLT